MHSNKNNDRFPSKAANVETHVCSLCSRTTDLLKYQGAAIETLGEMSPDGEVKFLSIRAPGSHRNVPRI